jgi:hypothetical protein
MLHNKTGRGVLPNVKYKISNGVVCNVLNLNATYLQYSINSLEVHLWT